MKGTTTMEQSVQKFIPLEELSYEQARDELKEIVRILELGQMSLEESLNYWERGEELAAYCEEYLDGASSRIETALAKRSAANASSASAHADSASAPDA